VTAGAPLNVRPHRASRLRHSPHHHHHHHQQQQQQRRRRRRQQLATSTDLLRSALTAAGEGRRGDRKVGNF